MKSKIENRKRYLYLSAFIVLIIGVFYSAYHFLFSTATIDVQTLLYVLCTFLLGMLAWQGWLRKRDKEAFLEGKAVLENELFVRREMENVVQQFTTDLQKAKEAVEDSNEKLKASEEQLKEANASKDKFFSILAHDLRSPLGSMMNLAQLFYLQYDKQTDTRRKEFIRMMLSSSQQVYNLLENLLQWSRSQSQRLQVFPVYMEVSELFYTNKQLFGNLAEEKGIRVCMEIENELGLKGDKNMLTTIIRNLLSNALKFTQQGGTICLRGTKDGPGWIQLQVIDNGVGMSEEVSDTLFSSENLSPSRGTQNETGTGLGLLVCKEFVKMHRGEIHVESQVGKGTTFTVLLPEQFT
ncbi:MAG: HAMP domain-containing sensor histidine kinase [Bacteroidales bacterium]